MEAADNGFMPPNTATAISRVKGAKQTGIRTGQWLTREQAENLIAAPNATTVKGKRDRALLAVLIGSGLRRREAAALTVGHIQLRDARWVVVDLIGKLVFRAVNRGGRVVATSITPRAICQVVRRFGDVIGAPNLAPHDLRRTFAKPAHKGRSGLDQIQLSLGHASVITTERYLGVRQDLGDAPCDHLGLTIEVRR